MNFTSRDADVEAERAKDVLNEAARRHGFLGATKEKLDGKFYVVTRARDDSELDHAYAVTEIDLETVRKDFAKWRADTVPEESLEVAVHYFMQSERRRLARRNGTSRLDEGTVAALLARCGEGKPSGDNLSPEQVKALAIAERLGWAP